ncbi:aldolase/citrate lyase family protein [uncultured Methylobacterium sp.]|uniref:aldolase/citrate lyase family protein n=1 Tax=uncultured Methylobacterium sp. TaxID=157278 RepID=UPI0035CC43BF
MHAILIVRPGEPPLSAPDGAQVYVRISTDDDLDAAMALRAAGLAIPVQAGGRDVARLGVRLAVHEAETGLADGSTRILALVETAGAVLALPTLVAASQRLCGIAWDADTLARDIGAAGSRDREGALIPPLALVRAQVLLAAAAAGVAAVDTACAVEAAFLREVEEARRDGFRAKVGANHAQFAMGAFDARSPRSSRSASLPPCGEG